MDQIIEKVFWFIVGVGVGVTLAGILVHVKHEKRQFRPPYKRKPHRATVDRELIELEINKS